MIRNTLAACAVAVTALTAATFTTASLQPAGAQPQAYPNRNITMVVPYPAGGSVDGVARVLAQKLQEALGVSVIVENRAGGAGGLVGANTVAKAQPDGYTLLLQASIHVVSPFLFKNVPYDVVKDFTPITLVAAGPLIVSTSPNVPAKNLKEFFDLVRKDPSKYTFATSSFGSAGHLAVELLKREAGVDALVIAYKGAGPMLTDLMSGQIQLIADPALSSVPLAQSGKIKALAVTSLKRTASAPEIPTVEESGMKPLDFVSWYGLWGPKGLPPEITAKLQEVSVKVLGEADAKKRFATLGFDPIGSTTAEFTKYIADEMARAEKIIKDSNIKTD
ncbi:tripartite tricarboxylate transporter substrate binding protein [Rhodoplanes sp. TEM]|uniref:Tripartite tricarboxylate transporter substrate binding protein n=1 Tax=Rhodoplanes tepidamans TaxID=200616 RepID=A0ABT5JAF4_RHOTP|nr:MULTISPECIES: tripartite tricarboxylate transporter substrate binding protein [Rhodoplanes]MDC7786617.1 tripartite tricarboxylate transporter substrate binding protein [Rhodoplanes tepidamans]MDC7983036.1 tripartite tricarboxylate transporter substrate binding protein [Rhodoplanes sp. TEM]MDQ0356418.1 tripartite-type tricarboxylate transporter receptor subunit TctC [Rhodoplanes tepidamans]